MGAGIISLIVGLIAAIGTVSGVIGSVASNKRNNATQIQLAGQQNQWNVEQWNRMNEYNSPLNQMQRLRSAGLNPSLAYGGGLVDAGSSSSPAASAELPNTRPSSYDGLANIGDGLNQLSGRVQQQPLIDAQADYYSQLADAERIDNITRGKQNALKIIQSEKLIDKTVQEIDNLKATKLFTEHEDARQAAESYQSIIESTRRVYNLELDGKLKQKELDTFDERFRLQCEEMHAKIRSLNADASYKAALRDEVMLRIRAGDAEFRSIYGSTEKDVEETIQNHFDVAMQELANVSQSAHHKGQNIAIDRQMIVFDNFIERVERVTHSIGNVFGFNASSSTARMEGSYTSTSRSTSLNRNVQYQNPNPHPSGTW